MEPFGWRGKWWGGILGQYLIYDGECPFCRNYVAFQQLRDRFPEIELIDARQNAEHRSVVEVQRRGLRIDDGMALLNGDQVLHGHEVMALFARGRTFQSRLFVDGWRGKAVYGLLKWGRKTTLKLLGRPPLNL